MHLSLYLVMHCRKLRQLYLLARQLLLKYLATEMSSSQHPAHGLEDYSTGIIYVTKFLHSLSS